MAKIIDERILKGKANRNNAIRNHFKKRFEAGMRYEVIEEEIILSWGLSPSTISKILKNEGYYKQ